MNRLIELLCASIGLWMPYLGPRVLDVREVQEELKWMALRLAAVLGPSVCQDAKQASTVLVKVWKHFVVEKIGSNEGCLIVV